MIIQPSLRMLMKFKMSQISLESYGMTRPVLTNITMLRCPPPHRIFSPILVEKCLVAGTYFIQQAASQNITGRSIGAFQWVRSGLAGFCKQNPQLPYRMHRRTDRMHRRAVRMHGRADRMHERAVGRAYDQPR